VAQGLVLEKSRSSRRRCPPTSWMSRPPRPRTSQGVLIPSSRRSGLYEGSVPSPGRGCDRCRAGHKRLPGTVAKNAEEAFNRHRLRRAPTQRPARPSPPPGALDLRGPLRIECTTSPTPWGRIVLMVVMETGWPNGATTAGSRSAPVDQDDFAAMTESHPALHQLLRERDEGCGGKRFSYRPTWSSSTAEGAAVGGVAAGGAGWRIRWPAWPRSSRRSTGRRTGAVASRGTPKPLSLQAVRDEPTASHHFHRSRRDKAMTRSVLDDIAGLGPGRRTRLLKGSAR